MTGSDGIARSLCVSAEAAADGRPRGSLSMAVAGGIAELTLHRQPRNILDLRTMDEMLAALAVLGREPELRVLVLGSSLDVFSAGVDVGEHRGATARPLLATFHRLLGTLEEFPAATVARVHGAALGGGLELALACDLRVVAEEARLGQPEIALGVFPPYAALRLQEIAGPGAAARLVLVGEAIDGNEAHAMGLADRVAPAAGLERALATLLAPLAARSASSLRLAKEALRLGRNRRSGSIEAIEALYLDTLMATHDADEGLCSFLEKRQPAWTHA